MKLVELVEAIAKRLTVKSDFKELDDSFGRIKQSLGPILNRIWMFGRTYKRIGNKQAFKMFFGWGDLNWLKLNKSGDAGQQVYNQALKELKKHIELWARPFLMEPILIEPDNGVYNLSVTVDPDKMSDQILKQHLPKVVQKMQELSDQYGLSGAAQASLTTAGPKGALDSDIWKKAEQEAKDQYGFEKPSKARFYSIVNKIYQNMGGRFHEPKE